MSLLDRFPPEFVKTRPPGNASYIEHSQIRQRLIRAQEDGLLRFQWQIMRLSELDNGEWLLIGRLTIHRPTQVDGRVVWEVQEHDVVGDPHPEPATCESRAFVRAVAFATGIGLQAWTGEAWYWLDKEPSDGE